MARRPTPRCSRSATACCRIASRSTSTTRASSEPAIVAEEFLLQYYTSALAIPSLIVVQQELVEGSELDVLADMLGERRGGAVEMRAAERGGKLRMLELAERNARLALDQEKLKAERRRQQRVESLSGLQAALGLDALPGADRVLRHQPRRRHPHRRLDGRVRGRRAEEGRLPQVHHPFPRSQRRLRFDGGGDVASLRAVGGPEREVALRLRSRRLVRDAAQPRGDRRRPGAAVGRRRGDPGLPRPRRRRRLARQADRGGLRPGRARAAAPGRTTRRSCSCCSASATRRTASPSPTTGSAATRR